MMPINLRLALLAISVIVAIFVLWKIRTSQFVIADVLYWVFFCVLLLVFGIFPAATKFCADLMSIESPANFVFSLFIFLLLVKVFFLSLKVSKLETKLELLVQKYALDKAKEKDSDNSGE